MLKLVAVGLAVAVPSMAYGLRRRQPTYTPYPDTKLATAFTSRPHSQMSKVDAAQPGLAAMADHDEQQQRTRDPQFLLAQLLLLLSLLYGGILYKPASAPVFSCICAVVCIAVMWRFAAGKTVSDDHDTTSQRPKQQKQQHSQQQPVTVKKSLYPRTHNLSGVWIKDREASDSMEPILHAMQVNRLIRGAVRLVKGMELKQDGDAFQIAVLSGILWFKITEQYPFSGEARQFKRRDLRKGMHRGTVQKLDDGAVCVTLEWDAPLGGIGTDVFYTVRDSLLYVDSTMIMEGQTLKYRTVYDKHGK